MIDKIKLSQILQDIGFKEKEATIYLTLLELNEALPSTIARKTGIKRPTTYLILELLQKRGLVSHIKRNGNLYFRAEDPNHFLETQKNKYLELKDSVHRLEEALPELRSLHHNFASTPQMSVYKGKEGLIQIMEDTLTTSTELLCWSNISLAVHTILNDYYPYYIKKKVKFGIPLKGVFGYEPAALEFKLRGKKELREVYLIPKDEFPFQNEINIYDDKVAIISHKDSTGVIIQNIEIANTQRSIFRLGFNYAKLLEDELLTDQDRIILNKKKILGGVLPHQEKCTCPNKDSICLNFE